LTTGRTGSGVGREKRGRAEATAAAAAARLTAAWSAAAAAVANCERRRRRRSTRRSVTASAVGDLDSELPRPDLTRLRTTHAQTTHTVPLPYLIIIHMSLCIRRMHGSRQTDGRTDRQLVAITAVCIVSNADAL